MLSSLIGHPRFLQKYCLAKSALCAAGSYLVGEIKQVNAMFLQQLLANYCFVIIAQIILAYLNKLREVSVAKSQEKHDKVDGKCMYSYKVVVCMSSPVHMWGLISYPVFKINLMPLTQKYGTVGYALHLK